MKKDSFTHAEEVKGGKDSHMHHKKMHDHHLKEAKKCAGKMMKSMKSHAKKGK